MLTFPTLFLLLTRYELGRQPANTKLAASHSKDTKDKDGKLQKVTTGDDIGQCFISVMCMRIKRTFKRARSFFLTYFR